MVFGLLTGCMSKTTEIEQCDFSQLSTKYATSDSLIIGKNIHNDEFIHFKVLFKLASKGTDLKTLEALITSRLANSNNLKAYIEALQYILDNLDLVAEGKMTITELFSATSILVDGIIDSNTDPCTLDIVVIEGDYAYYIFVYGKIYILEK